MKGVLVKTALNYGVVSLGSELVVASWYNHGYTEAMKTAVSLPDEVFRRAEALAESLQMSRSELYATALAAFVAEHESADITERLNQVYERQSSALDPVLDRMQVHSLPTEQW